MAASAEQLRVWGWHKQVSDSLHINPISLFHRKLKGTIVANGDNQVYTGPGPVTSFTSQFQNTYSTYWIFQEYLRGEQRQDDFEMAVVTVPTLQAQVPAIDNSFNVMLVAQDDFIQDAAGNYWRMVNPTLSPEGSYWAFIAERQR